MGCDLPVITFEDMIKFIKSDIKPDAVFWTGDIVPHDLAVHAYDLVYKYQDYIAKTIKQDFKDYDTYAILGNHEFEVFNSQDFKYPYEDRNINLAVQ